MKEIKELKGKVCSDEELARLDCKYDHGIGVYEIWVFVNHHVTWILRDRNTKVIKEVVTNYN